MADVTGKRRRTAQQDGPGIEGPGQGSSSGEGDGAGQGVSSGDKPKQLICEQAQGVLRRYPRGTTHEEIDWTLGDDGPINPIAAMAEQDTDEQDDQVGRRWHQ